MDGNDDCRNAGPGNREAGSGRDRAHGGARVQRSPHHRRKPDDPRRSGHAGALRCGGVQGALRRTRRLPHLLALQAGGAQLPAGGHQGRVPQRSGGGRPGGRHHGRALLGRVARADPVERKAGGRRGREVPARRRVQAAQLALQLPGHGRRGPEAAARSRRPDRPAGRSPK